MTGIGCSAVKQLVGGNREVPLLNGTNESNHASLIEYSVCQSLPYHEKARSSCEAVIPMSAAADFASRHGPIPRIFSAPAVFGAPHYLLQQIRAQISRAHQAQNTKYHHPTLGLPRLCLTGTSIIPDRARFEQHANLYQVSHWKSCNTRCSP